MAIPGLISFFLFSERISDEEFDVFAPQSRNLNISSTGDVVFNSYRATGFAIERLPVFFYAFFFAISWGALWGLKYASIIVPEILIRLVNLVTGPFNSSKRTFVLGLCMLLLSQISQ